MDALREFLVEVKQQGIARGNFLGLLNVVIGRRVQTSAGALVCGGCSWRALASYLKLVRWDKDAVRELGTDPKALHPRNRARYWFQAIVQAAVDSEEALKAGDRLAAKLTSAGYVVGRAPPTSSNQPESGVQV
jgi:hypothetical protein